jgi:hypothetical protein
MTIQGHLGRQVYKKLGRDTVERFLASREKEYMDNQQPEQALWCATVRKAWADAFYKITPASGNGGSKQLPASIKRDAINWLTGEGNNEKDRISCCDSCDISPEWIKQEALKALKEGPPQPAPPNVYTGDLDDCSMRTTNTNWCRIREMEKAANERKKLEPIAEGV